jgi:hypothetical protein
LHLLDVDGMSSEESEGDVNGEDRRYHIKGLPWRSLDLSRWLRHIDQFPYELNPNNRRRSTRRRRSESNKVSIGRVPPRGLPASFFCEAWLEQQSQGALHRLGLSVTEKMDLPKLPLFRVFPGRM